VIYLLKPLARLATFVLLVALALLGLVVALAGILGVATVAELVRLPGVANTVGGWLQAIDGPDAFPRATALGALVAILAGLLLLVGALGRTPDRLVLLEEAEGGRLAARPRALAQVADALIGRIRGVSDRRVRLKPRKGGGDLRVTATHTRSVQPQAVEAEVRQAVAPITDAFGVRTRVKPRLADSGRRVE
jgi:hypothetical protein